MGTRYRMSAERSSRFCVARAVVRAISVHLSESREGASLDDEFLRLPGGALEREFLGRGFVGSQFTSGLAGLLVGAADGRNLSGADCGLVGTECLVRSGERPLAILGSKLAVVDESLYLGGAGIDRGVGHGHE